MIPKRWFNKMDGTSKSLEWSCLCFKNSGPQILAYLNSLYCFTAPKQMILVLKNRFCS